MPTQDDPNQSPGKIDALLRFIYSPEEDVAEMSDSDIAEFLKAEGLDPGARITDMRERLAAIEGAERLAEARRKMAEDERVAKPKTGQITGDIRAELMRRLDQLRNRNPQVAGMYARNFDKLSEADMLDMLDDLAELERIQADDDARSS